MRTATLTLLILGLAGSQAMAVPRGTKLAFLRITNRCDEAVEVTLDSGGNAVLEPNALVIFYFGGNRLPRPTVTAALVSNSAISDSERCRLNGNETTIVTIDCSTTASGVSLDVNCLKPGQTLAFVERETSVTLASTVGLGLLLLLGMLLGRTPKPQSDMHWVKRRIDSVDRSARGTADPVNPCAMIANLACNGVYSTSRLLGDQL